MVYLLHFSSRISPDHACQHYLGSADDLEKRMKLHKAGRGCRLADIALQRGIDFQLARTWAGGRQEERQLKNQKNGRRLCPICNPRSDQK